MFFFIKVTNVKQVYKGLKSEISSNKKLGAQEENSNYRRKRGKVVSIVD